jgi:hypothetical protein
MPDGNQILWTPVTPEAVLVRCRPLKRNLLASLLQNIYIHTYIHTYHLRFIPDIPRSEREIREQRHLRYSEIPTFYQSYSYEKHCRRYRW